MSEIIILQGRCWQSLFIDEQIEAQRGPVLFLRSKTTTLSWLFSREGY